MKRRQGVAAIIRGGSGAYCGAGGILANNSSDGPPIGTTPGAGVGTGAAAGTAVGTGDPNCRPNRGNLKKVRKGRQRMLKAKGVDFEELKKEVQAGPRQDIYEDKCGNFYVGNKNGSGEFELIGNWSHLF